MGHEVFILVIEAITVYFLVLAAHSLRHKFGHAHFYALIGGITAVMSWLTDAGVAVHVGEITFVVGSTVFYTSLILGVFVVYVFDGPRATRIVISTIIGVSIIVPVIAALLHFQMNLIGPGRIAYVPLPSLRINAASVFATLIDLVFLAVAWESLGKPKLNLKLWLQAFLTLLGVMWLDVLLFATGAFAGSPDYLNIMKGTLVSRLFITIFAFPFLCIYLYWQNQKEGYKIENRPVLAILKRVAEIETELSRANQEIEKRKKAEAELNQIFSMSLDLICTADIRNTAFLKVNPAFTETLGYTATELLSNSFMDFVHPEDLDRTRQVVNEKLRHGKKILNFENRYRCKDGTYRWLSWVAQPHSEKNLVYAVARDITQWKQRETELQEQKSLLDITGRMAKVGGWEVDAATHEVRWTEETYRIHEVFFGHKPSLQEAIRFFHPDDRQKLSDGIQQALQEGTPYDMELRFITAQGNHLWTRTIGQPQREEGKTVRLFGAFQDITDRKKTEETLRQNEEKLRAILEANPDPIVVYDNSGVPQYLNPAFTELFGWRLEELAGRTIPFVPADQKGLTQQSIQEIYETGRPVRAETKRLTKDGRLIDVIASAAIIKGTDGSPAGLVVCLTDISRTKELEEQLRHAHKMEAIGTLSGGIAHEFNNMLGIIIGNADLAAEEVSPDGGAAAHIMEIQKASQRSKHVVQKLLGIARKAPASRKPVRIGRIVQESMELLKKTLPASVRIRSEIACQSEAILADETEIHQLLMNLCTNSVHAMPGQTGTLDLKLETVILDGSPETRFEDSEQGAYARLTITDNGAGIAPEILDRIFDPYFTTKDVDEGLGMGLAVVKSIVENHDGTIRARSQIGVGTTMEVLFPIAEAGPGAAEDESGILPSGTERILFVDDEISIVRMASITLEKLGYAVLGETDSLTALKRFRENPEGFDLVVSDTTMPDLTGDHLAKEILRIRPETPIILFTGHSDRMDEHRAKAIGIRAFATKPITGKELAIIVRRALDNPIESGTRL